MSTVISAAAAQGAADAQGAQGAPASTPHSIPVKVAA